MKIFKTTTGISLTHSAILYYVTPYLRYGANALGYVEQSYQQNILWIWFVERYLTFSGQSVLLILAKSYVCLEQKTGFGFLSETNVGCRLYIYHLFIYHDKLRFTDFFESI